MQYRGIRVKRALTSSLFRNVSPPGAPAPGPDVGRRERVARAWATVAGYGGPFADPHLRHALLAAKAYAARRGAAAALAAALADALQDAGCAEPSVLGHCRGPGPHAPECWVVGSLLDPEHR